MKIPIDQEYTFTIKVLEEDSLNPQDLSHLDSATFSVLSKENDSVGFVVNTENAGTAGYWSKIGGRLKTTVTDTTLSEEAVIETINAEGDTLYTTTSTTVTSNSSSTGSSDALTTDPDDTIVTIEPTVRGTATTSYVGGITTATATRVKVITERTIVEDEVIVEVRVANNTTDSGTIINTYKRVEAVSDNSTHTYSNVDVSVDPGTTFSTATTLGTPSIVTSGKVKTKEETLTDGTVTLVEYTHSITTTTRSTTTKVTTEVSSEVSRVNVTKTTTTPLVDKTITSTVMKTFTGVITFTVHANNGLVPSTGPKEDGYYNKAGYKGSIVLKFLDRGDINTFIEDITPVRLGA